MRTNKREIGTTYENRALQFLLKKGCKILEKNYSCKLGEIDLIGLDPSNRIIFVEVKYRSSLEYGPPQLAVHYKKMEHIVKTALVYIKEKKLNGRDFRFDVMAISPSKIEYIPNAFSSLNYSL